MALEMKVFAEVANYEPKPMFGRTWRQLGALAYMTFVGGGVFAGITFLSIGLGAELSDATSQAMYVMFPVLIPAAAYGWWRPKGLMPEEFLGFWLRRKVKTKEIGYADTYESGESVSRVRRGTGPGRRPSRRFRREVSEHASESA